MEGESGDIKKTETEVKPDEKREKTNDLKTSGAGYSVGKNKPPVHTQFSSTNQPDPKKQRETKRKKRETREFLKVLINMDYKFPDESKVAKQLEASFGRRVRSLSAVELIALQQFQKAILTGDTRAAEFVFNNAYGPVKQIMEHSGLNGGPIETKATVTKVIIENPHAKKDNG